jgi:hypothetical protein
MIIQSRPAVSNPTRSASQQEAQTDAKHSQLPERQQLAGDVNVHAGSWAGMGTDGFQPPGTTQTPAHASRCGLAHGFTPGQLSRVTQPILSEASNNARMYRPQRKRMKI